MKLRAVAAAAATIFVALVVALAVPVSQLRTFSAKTWCCCPDPAKCHCPHEKPSHQPGQPSMKTCHQTTQPIVAPVAPGFAAPQVASVVPPPRAVRTVFVRISAPHAPPAAARPEAPS